MTKQLHLIPQDSADALRGVLKYYVVAALLGVLIVGGLAYWTLAGAH